MKKKIIIAVIILALGGAALFMMFKPESQATPNRMMSTTAPIEKKFISQTVFSDGIIASKSNNNLYSKITSTLVSVNVNEGDHVQAGDVIAVLDTTDLQHSLKSAEYQLKLDTDALEDLKSTDNSAATANYQKALSSYNSAKEDHVSNESLYNSGIISADALNTSKSTLDSTYVSYLTAKDNLNITDIGRDIEQKTLKVALDQMDIDSILLEIEAATILSPTDGTIVSAISDINKSITKGELLFSIENLDDLVVEAAISEYEINQIQLGQEVIIELLSHDKVYHGTIVSIAPKGSTETEVTIPITIEITDEDTAIKPNYSANIEIIIASKESALVVPYEAIKETNKGSMLMISRNGQEMMIQVEKGIVSDVYIEVISDEILEGDQIVLTNYTTAANASNLPLAGMGLRSGNKK